MNIRKLPGFNDADFLKGNWDENKHPRASDGKFSGGGSSSGKQVYSNSPHRTHDPQGMYASLDEGTKTPLKALYLSEHNLMEDLKARAQERDDQFGFWGTKHPAGTEDDVVREAVQLARSSIRTEAFLASSAGRHLADGLDSPYNHFTLQQQVQRAFNSWNKDRGNRNYR